MKDACLTFVLFIICLRRSKNLGNKYTLIIFEFPDKVTF